MDNCHALVSIIVPVYKAEAYLPACIDSLLRQSHSHIQIILVDDQSPDNCPEICDGYARKDSRVTVIHQENKGVSGARNTGMDHAIGDFIMFVDSDDELLPDAVSILLRDAYEYNADVVSADAERIDGKGAVIPAALDGVRRCYSGDEPLLLSLAGNVHTNAVWAKLFKASFIRNIRFEEGKNINEDGFFFFQCCVNRPVLVCHGVAVYRYFLRQESCSRQRFSDKFLSMLWFCDRKKEILEAEFPQYTEQRNNMEARTNLELLQVMCSTTDKKYKNIQKGCIKTVRALYADHKPVNLHFKKVAWIVAHGLYPLYKLAIRIKYYR